MQRVSDEELDRNVKAYPSNNFVLDLRDTRAKLVKAETALAEIKDKITEFNRLDSVTTNTQLIIEITAILEKYYAD